MSTLRDIRSRIRSVANIKQITKTMEMVAAAQLRRAQERAEQLRTYTIKIKELIEDLSKVDKQNPLFEKRDVKKIGFVVVAGDRGLAGSYHTAIFLEAEKFLQKQPKEKIELILIGKKAVDYFRLKKWPIKHQVLNWGGKITDEEVKALADQLVNWFLAHELDEIYILSTEYISIMSRKLVLEKFLNVEKIEETQEEYQLDYIFEPSVDEIFSQLLTRYFGIKIQNILDQAYAAELAARIIAMKSATKNAEEMITELTLVLNKVRQENITKEMIEITSGMNKG
jgi:F-type H+-transporting ATPase subunit gamma